METFTYERQIPSRTELRCGAAALCMVLRDFGIDASQEQIWDEMKTPVPEKPDVFRINTYRLAAFALKCGINAIVGRLRKPLAFLEKLRSERGYRLILNHRIRADSPLGHFTVFTKMETSDQTIFLHDPQKGPNRKISWAELANLWKPVGENCEISGYVGVLFFRTDLDHLSDAIHWSMTFDPTTGLRVDSIIGSTSPFDKSPESVWS